MSTAKLSKSTIKRKIITSILTISLVLGSFSLAFAYPTTADKMADALGSGWSNTNGLSAPYGKDMSQSWYYIFGKSNLAYLRDLRYQLTGNDYDTHSGTSIYTMINNINQSLNSPSSSIYSLLTQQASKIDQINSTLGTGSSLSNVLTKLDAVVNWTSSTNTGINTLINNGVSVDGIEELISNTAIWTTPTYYPFTYSYRTAINSNPVFYSSNTNGLNIGIRADETTGALKFATQTINNQSDYLSLMHNDLMQLSMRMQTMGATYNPVVYDPDGNAYSYNAQSIMDALVTYGNNYGTMMNDIRSGVNGFRNEYNNINWENAGTYNGTKQNLNGSFLSSAADGTEFYVSYNVPQYTNVFRFSVPLSLYTGASSSAEIDINVIQSNAQYSVEYDIKDYEISYSSTGGMLIYASIPNLKPNLPIVLHITSDKTIRYITTLEASVKSVSRDSKDLLDVNNNIILNNIVDLFEQAKYMFFDDESIQAKKNNAVQTTAVLTGFTGSGQASATANDYGTLSTGVSDVKGGMNTNVSANNAFGIFNNSNGYSFWSAATLQELNQSGTNTRSLSKSANDPGYEYYDNRLEYLHNAMNGGDK